MLDKSCTPIETVLSPFPAVRTMRRTFFEQITSPDVPDHNPEDYLARAAENAIAFISSATADRAHC